MSNFHIARKIQLTQINKGYVYWARIFIYCSML